MKCHWCKTTKGVKKIRLPHCLFDTPACKKCRNEIGLA